MGDDNWDPSSYYRNGYVPPRRRRMPTKPKPTSRNGKPSAARIKRDSVDAIPPSQIKTAIKQLLAFEPHLQVDDIFKRLNFSVTVSRVTVSVIRTEFRHSLKVIQDAGLLK